MAAAVEIPVTERYRSVILSVGGVLAAALLQLSELMVPGRPLGGVELINLIVAVAVSAGVYFPADPWIKFLAGLAGAVGQTIAAGYTDGRFTPAEVVLVGITALGALGIGAFPNAPALVVGETGADVPDGEPGGDAGYGVIEFAIGILVLLIVIVLLFRVLG